MTIINRISQLIDDRRINQNDFCKVIGISTSTFSTWKTRNTDPPAKYLNAIAEYFEVTTDYLLGKEDDSIQVYDEDDNIVVIDDETRDIIDSLRTNPDMKILFSVTKKATKEDIRKAVKIIEALRDDSEVT